MRLPRFPGRREAKERKMTAKKGSQFQTLTSARATTFEEPSAVQEVPVSFVLSAPKAESVSVAGAFNCWDVKALKMKKDKQGRWSSKISLKPGRYEYLFMVDGQWLRDPAAKETIQNPFGSVNSVLKVG